MAVFRDRSVASRLFCACCLMHGDLHLSDRKKRCQPTSEDHEQCKLNDPYVFRKTSAAHGITTHILHRPFLAFLACI